MPIPVARLELSKKRIKSILAKSKYANKRQLESKICEAGPTPQRCDPHVVSQAIRELCSSGELVQTQHPIYPTGFYHLADLDKTAKSRKVLKDRQKYIDHLYSRYLSYAQNDSRLCGDALETVMRSAFAQASSLYFEMGSKENPQLVFGNKCLPGALDGVFMLGSKGILLAVETKNIREWIYPSSVELWSLIHKANTITEPSCPVLPVIICRKIPYYAFAAFKQLGILGYEVHNQFFDLSLETELIDIKHKDGLGFHDIKTELVYPPKLVSFLKETVLTHGPEYARRFLQNKELLDEVAPILQSSDTRGPHRNNLWRKVKEELGLSAAMAHHE